MENRRNSHCLLLGKLKEKNHLEDLKEMGVKKGVGGIWNRLNWFWTRKHGMHL